MSSDQIDFSKDAQGIMEWFCYTRGDHSFSRKPTWRQARIDEYISRMALLGRKLSAKQERNFVEEEWLMEFKDRLEGKLRYEQDILRAMCNGLETKLKTALPADIQKLRDSLKRCQNDIEWSRSNYKSALAWADKEIAKIKANSSW